MDWLGHFTKSVYRSGDWFATQNDSLVKRHAGDSILCGDVAEQPPTFVPRHGDDVPSVTRLRLSSGPITIVARVSAIVISAFQAVLGSRSMSHVSHELLEAQAPLRRHAKPTLPVVFKASIFSLIASSLSPVPRAIFRRLFMISSCAVCNSVSGDVRFQASTALSFPGDQVGARDKRLFSTVTATRPPHNGSITRISVWPSRHDDEATISTSCFVGQWWHQPIVTPSNS